VSTLKIGDSRSMNWYMYGSVLNLSPSDESNISSGGVSMGSKKPAVMSMVKLITSPLGSRNLMVTYTSNSPESSSLPSTS